MTIIERIFNAMESKNIKMADLSRHLNVYSSVVSNWKTRNTNPPAELIIQICELIDEDVMYILTGEKEIKTEKLTKEEQNIIELYNQLTEKNKGKAEMFMEQKIEQQNEDIKSSVSPNTNVG